MITNLLSSPTTRLLEQAVNFTEQRHQVILTNIANASTPGYVQQDVSVAGFQKSLRDAIDKSRQSPSSNCYEPESNDTVDFVPHSSLLTVKPHDTRDAMAFHDRGVRSMESLMGNLADNALAHNTLTQLLRNRYEQLTKAITMKP